MYTGTTAASVRQVKGRGADIQNMALEWRTERKAFPTGCDGISRYRKRYQSIPPEAFCANKA